MSPMLHLSQDPEADRLISENPLALLIGMVLDQQVPLEWAFAGPAELKRRIGGLVVSDIASMDPEELTGAFSARPALHRFPGSMATRVLELCRVVADRYEDDASNVWKGAKSGSELLARVRELPGFGDRKAKIFVALLGKQLGVRPPGWKDASAPFSEPGSFQSVADIVDPGTRAKARAFKQQLKRSTGHEGRRKMRVAKKAKTDDLRP